MSFGFRVLSDSGKIAAGSDLANLFFQSKGFLYIGSGGAAEPAHSEDSVVFYISPLPLIRRAGALFLGSMGSYKNGYWSGQAYVAGTIEYFIFSPPPLISNETYGINVYDENGKPTFSSNSKALQIVSVVNVYGDAFQYVGTQGGRLYTPYAENVGLGGYPGKLAFALGGTRVYWTSLQIGSGSSFFTDTFRDVRGLHLDGANNLNSTTVRTGFQRYSGLQGNFNYSPNGGMPLSLIVADVTGL